MEKTKIKAVYFDAGETLVYRNPSLTVITYRELKKRGAAVSIQAVERALAAAAVRMAPVTAKGKMTDSEKWNLYIKSVFRMLRVKNTAAEASLKMKLKKGTSFRAFRDAVYVLKKLRKMGIKTGVISNAPSELRSILEAAGISEFAGEIIVSEEAGFEKPDRRIFMQALKSAGCRPCEMLFVGDNVIADIRGAAAAGITPLWIKRASRHSQFSFGSKSLPGSAVTIRSLKQVFHHVSKAAVSR